MNTVIQTFIVPGSKTVPAHVALSAVLRGDPYVLPELEWGLGITNGAWDPIYLEKIV